VHARYGRLFTPLTLAPTGRNDASGKIPVGFPGMQGSLTTTFRDRLPWLGEAWEWYSRGEATYTGRIYVDEINQSWIDPRLRLNLRLGLEKDGTRLELYGENLLNDQAWVSAVRGSASNFRVGPATVSQPTAFAVLPRLRIVGIRASYEF
jgi:outer membrane receptor protein involved in Fe transport